MRWPWNKKSKKETPFAAVTPFRETNEPAALVFVAGFTGRVGDSWKPFIDQVLQLSALSGWSVLGLDYTSNRRIDLSGWERDPDINLLSRYFRTELAIDPFAKYKTVALVTHSMGGLVVQRALIDDDVLSAKVSHLFLYGVPSSGVPLANLMSRFKKQIRDMVVDGDFINKLRADWSTKFGRSTTFHLTAIAGDADDFVGANSTLEPFPEKSQRVIPGNHSSMVRPESADHPGVLLLSSTLQGSDSPSFIDSARLAVERREFQDAVDRLMQHYNELDDAALVTLAMALDGLGKSDDALTILDDEYQKGRKTTAEAAGILAGRVKRRWLAERKKTDLDRATELYQFGMTTAETEGDHNQILYHAINLAFLKMMGADATADIHAITRKLCAKALEHCALAKRDHWCIATEGEAHLMQGDFVKAEEKYREAVSMTNSPREIRSMSDQASRIADRTGGQARVQAIQPWFARNSASLRTE